MYVLYQVVIIWLLPDFSTIEKKVEKKVSPPISPFLGGKRLNLFFSPFLDPLPVYEFLYVRMSDCCLQGIKPCECKGKGFQWVGNQVFRLGLRKESKE